MRTLLRRRVSVPAAVVIVIVAVAGAAWLLLSEGRRMGSAVERLLVRRTGLPITVQRASWNGRRLFLRDVHLSPSPSFPVEAHASELTMDAGIMLLIAPSGRAVSVASPSASIILPESLAVDRTGLEALREQILSWLAADGALAIRVERARLQTPGGVVTCAVAFDRKSSGLALTLTAIPEGESSPLRVNVRAFAALGRALDVIIDVAGSARGIGTVWPAAAPSASSVTARIQLQVLAGGVVSSVGRLSVGTSAADRTALDFTSRYDAASGDLGISRYMLAWGDVRLSGTASLARESAGRRLSATAAGAAAGSTVNATASYEMGGGTFEAEIRLDGADAGQVARRLGVEEKIPLAARNVHARLSGRAEAKTMRVYVDPAASRVTTGSDTIRRP